MINRSSHRLLPLAAILVPAGAVNAGTRYEIVPLSETIGTGVSIVGTDLNNAGMVSGIATSSFIDDLAFKPWRQDVHTGVLVDLAPWGSANQYLYGGPISDSGMVAGFYLTQQPLEDGDPGAAVLANAGLPVPFGTTSQALFWNTDGSGTFTPIPGLGSILGLTQYGNIVLDINSAGACVGISRDGSNNPVEGERAFLYDEAGVLHDLSGVGGPGTIAFSASGIADDGAICGVLRTGEGVDQGFVLDSGGTLTFLPLVFNSPEGAESVYPSAINSTGQVIGVAMLVVEPKGQPFPKVFQRGFLWDPVAGVTDLGNFFPHALNDSGVLTATLGLMTPLGPQIHAFVRYASGTWVDLNSVVSLPSCDGGNWLSRAPAINNAGEILVVEQWCPDSVFIEFRSHVLVPQPECVGDISSDGVVNVDDLLAVISSWGVCASPCAPDIAPPGGNGQVNVDDLLLVIVNWGQCP